jgi:hypothetical protein
MNMAKELFFTFCLLLATHPVIAQVNKVEPYNCTFNSHILDNVHHLGGETGLIIVIARLGDGESNRALNRRRLHNVRSYLTESGWNRDPQTIILAEGERVKGYGRIEFYIQGNLFTVLGVNRNRDFAAGSCLSKKKAGEIFYPYRSGRLWKPKSKR